MYQVYSDSPYIVHDNNFSYYCKPHLLNLPAGTAFELQTIRDKLQPDDQPPYRPIQLDALPEPTVPTFKRSLSQAYEMPPPLKPRAQWMKETPPLLTDREADDAYNKVCAWMFGTSAPLPDLTLPSSPETVDLERQIAALQTQLRDRAVSKSKTRTSSAYSTAPSPLLDEPTLHAREQPRFHNLAKSTDKQEAAIALQPGASTTVEDIRLLDHPKHAAFQQLRGQIERALRRRHYIHDFNRHYVPTTAPCPRTFAKLTALLAHQDRIEQDLENLHTDVAADGTPLDPKRDIEPEYEILSEKVTNLNRALFIEYVVFLSPSGIRESYSPTRREPVGSPRYHLGYRDPDIQTTAQSDAARLAKDKKQKTDLAAAIRRRTTAPPIPNSQFSSSEKPTTNT